MSIMSDIAEGYQMGQEMKQRRNIGRGLISNPDFVSGKAGAAPYIIDPKSGDYLGTQEAMKANAAYTGQLGGEKAQLFGREQLMNLYHAVGQNPELFEAALIAGGWETAKAAETAAKVQAEADAGTPAARAGAETAKAKMTEAANPEAARPLISQAVTERAGTAANTAEQERYQSGLWNTDINRSLLADIFGSELAAKDVAANYQPLPGGYVGHPFVNNGSLGYNVGSAPWSTYSEALQQQLKQQIMGTGGTVDMGNGWHMAAPQGFGKQLPGLGYQGPPAPPPSQTRQQLIAQLNQQRQQPEATPMSGPVINPILSHIANAEYGPWNTLKATGRGLMGVGDWLSQKYGW